MAHLFQKAVFVVDSMAFRRARDECFLAPWAKQENVELIGVLVEEAHAKLVQDANCEMLIYILGDALPSSQKVLAEIRMLRAICPAAALAIVTDDNSLDSVISAVNAGVRGYFYNDMAPDIALQALSFVLHGGSYLPPDAMLTGRLDNPSTHDGSGMHDSDNSAAHRDRGEMPGAAQPHTRASLFTESAAQQQASLTAERPARAPGEHSNPHINGAHLNGTANGSGTVSEIAVVRPPSRMTERQQSVLECLCQGDSNKVIGRKLSMTEMTVKVHVREIMRKLGAANRTQVAILCSRNGRDAGTVSGLLSLEASEAAALSPKHQD